MSMITYGIIEETYRLGNNARTSYGIAVYADADRDGTTTVLSSVSDVSPDRRPLERLVEWCNLLQLSPTHLRDVIDDFLSV